MAIYPFSSSYSKNAAIFSAGPKYDLPLLVAIATLLINEIYIQSMACSKILNLVYTFCADVLALI